MGGLECATQIRRRNIDIPIIAVTANARSEQVQEVSEQGQRSCQSAETRGPCQIMACGMNAAVAKPFSTAELMKQMWQLVAAREAGEASTTSD
jgi:CheY-like chemotaxis protein